jgi:hypothetical protein
MFYTSTGILYIEEFADHDLTLAIETEIFLLHVGLDLVVSKLLTISTNRK